MQFPSLARWQRYPVTVGIAVSAVVMTLWSDFGRNQSTASLCDMTAQFWARPTLAAVDELPSCTAIICI